MNRKRIFAISKLVVLFGTPVALILGLFSCGVYCGVENRHPITSFERDWLGMDVEVPPAPTETPTPAAPSADPNAPTDPSTPPPTPAPTPSGGAPAAAAPATPPPTSPAPTATPPAPSPTTPAAPSTPPTRTDPLAGDLAGRLALPVTVRVKVLVDDELIAARPDWIDYVQRTVAAASQVYEDQFGITLRLASVGRWPVMTEGLGADQLLDDVRAHPREGNDILVGFTERPLPTTGDDRVTGKAETPTAESAFNGAYGVVYATSGHRHAHLRTMLHEVGHIFGATDITDPADPAYQAASWMSYSPARETDAPWIDADNRRRVLERKDKPFAPEAAAP
jgi:hypothetical protein